MNLPHSGRFAVLPERLFYSTFCPQKNQLEAQRIFEPQVD
jgi:hypothetical protein